VNTSHGARLAALTDKQTPRAKLHEMRLNTATLEPELASRSIHGVRLPEPKVGTAKKGTRY